MFVLDMGRNSLGKIEQMHTFFEEHGVKIRKKYVQDSSPYFIIGSGTSISYRTRSKWNQKGIVFFCTEEDKNNLVEGLGVKAYDNSSDSDRPYAIFLSNKHFEEAVEILLKNSANQG